MGVVNALDVFFFVISVVLFSKIHTINCGFFCFIEESPNTRRKRNYQQSEADRWLKQAQHDLESSYSDMHPSTGQAAYDWVCYKCYRVRSNFLFCLFNPICHAFVSLF